MNTQQKWKSQSSTHSILLPMLMGAPSPVFYEKKTSNNKQMATIPEDRYPPDFEDLWAKEGPGFLLAQPAFSA